MSATGGSQNWRGVAIGPINGDVDLIPFRKNDLTPWRDRAASRERTVESVRMTRVEITRARVVDHGSGRAASSGRDEWIVEDEPVRVHTDDPARVVNGIDGSARAEPQAAASAFEHQAMTPIPTEGFLDLWASRHRGDHVGPAPRRAAATFRAFERALAG